MTKVICTLENASDVINGFKFVTHAQGMISEELSAEHAEHFLSIKGYSKVSPKGLAVPTDLPQKKDPEKAPDEIELERLRARADELEIKYTANTKSVRLAADIDAAEEAIRDMAAAEALKALGKS